MRQAQQHGQWPGQAPSVIQKGETPELGGGGGLEEQREASKRNCAKQRARRQAHGINPQVYLPVINDMHRMVQRMAQGGQP